jgi:cofilin
MSNSELSSPSCSCEGQTYVGQIFYFLYDFATEISFWDIHYFFFIRSPSTSRIRAKMLYATTKERFRRELDGVHYEIQATDPTEMDLEVLRDRAH